MLKVSELITEIRARTHDEQETGYTDDTLLSYINDGIRFIRRTIFSINPLLIADYTQEGTLTAGDRKIAIEETSESDAKTSVRLARICSVRVDGRELEQINPSEIYDLKHTGRPEFYYLTGFATINVWPVPDIAYDYEITAVRDVALLTKVTDISPLPTEMDDWLYEYATLRASVTNEFDVSQESGLFRQIVAQIENMCYQLSPRGVTASGYWDSLRKTRDAYTGRRRCR